MTINNLRCIGTIGVMWQNHVSTRFMHSLSQMLLYSQRVLCGPDEFIHYSWALQSFHEMGRNELADNMLGDWIYMTDTDHMFAPDILQRLLTLRAKYKTPVLSGMYQFKHPPYSPVANIWGEDGSIIPLTNWDPSLEVMEIGPCGGGSLLIERNVFNQIQNKFQEKPFSPSPNSARNLSEDYWFFWKCKQLGIPTYLAPRVEAHHLLPDFPLHIADYLAVQPPFEQPK